MSKFMPSILIIKSRRIVILIVDGVGDVSYRGARRS
jgi:hypothetical protein